VSKRIRERRKKWIVNAFLSSFHESLSFSTQTLMPLHHSVKSSLLELGLQFELGLEGHLISGASRDDDYGHRLASGNGECKDDKQGKARITSSAGRVEDHQRGRVMHEKDVDA